MKPAEGKDTTETTSSEENMHVYATELTHMASVQYNMQEVANLLQDQCFLSAAQSPTEKYCVKVRSSRFSYINAKFYFFYSGIRKVGKILV